ncbi:MAG: UbiD family decarboxylase, partial [Humidesulfovibrio sp.]|nr:UbiD family decarboxylase [Humidesulfovibrio sp.]
MPYKDLQDFLKHLDKNGEIKRIDAELDPYLEIAEVTDRVCKKFGPALLFQKVKGSRFPVLTNMYGSYKRMNMALDSENLDALGERIHEYLEIERPDGIIKKLQMIPKLSRLTNI